MEPPENIRLFRYTPTAETHGRFMWLPIGSHSASEADHQLIDLESR